MASQNMIMQFEDGLIKDARDLENLLEVWNYELQTEDTGHPIPANRDCWGTLYVNAHALRNRLDTLLAAMDSEFGDDKDFGKEKYGKNA